MIEVKRSQRPFVGITVMPEYLHSEGVDPVLGNLVEKAGATAVARALIADFPGRKCALRFH